MKSHFPFTLSLLFLISCHQTRYIDHLETTSQKISSVTIKNAELDSLINPYKKKYTQTMFDTLAYNFTELSKGKGESTLGNWVADALVWYTDSVLNLQSDFSIVNSGGIRVKSLPAGPILLKHIYELMPFDNSLVILELDSALVDSITSHVASGWPISKNYHVLVDYKNNTATWEVTKKSQGKKIRVVLSDFLANGGDKMNYLIPLKQEHTRVLMRDALIAYARHQKNLYAKIEGRISKKQ